MSVIEVIQQLGSRELQLYFGSLAAVPDSPLAPPFLHAGSLCRPCPASSGRWCTSLPSSMAW